VVRSQSLRHRNRPGAVRREVAPGRQICERLQGGGGMLTRGARARRAVRAQRQAKLQAALEELMTLVLRTVNDKKDHIPPVVSSAVLTFSFDISVAGCVAARALLACASV